VVVADWYGAEERTVEVVSNTALWYSTGLPAVPLRWVLIRDLLGKSSEPRLSSFAPIWARSLSGSSRGL
jgi:hypothetical protein